MTTTYNSDSVSENLVQIAQDFFAALFDPSDHLTIRLIESWMKDGKKQSEPPRTFEYAASTVPTLLNDLAATAQSMRACLFYGVCPRFAAYRYNQAWQIRTVRCLWADLDNMTTDRALQVCEQVSIPFPSIVVNSGNGTHLYWLLDTPYLIDDVGDPVPCYAEYDQEKKQSRKYIIAPATKERDYKMPSLSPKAARVKGILAGMAHRLGGDHTIDLARLLRIPGPLNRKNERNGQEPRPTALGFCDGARRFPIDSFAPLALEQGQERSGAARASRKDAAPAEDHYAQVLELYPLRDEAERPSLDQQIRLCDEAADRSKADFALCAAAIRGGWPMAEVWELVEDISKFEERGESYFNETWHRAANAIYKQEEWIWLVKQDTKGRDMMEDKEVRRPVFLAMDSKELATRKYDMKWIVQRMLVRGQPGAIGGPKKAMKTSLLVDLILSLASGTSFLNHFHVYEKMRPGFLSGESGGFTLKETALRVCKAKGIRLEDTDIWWGERLPKLDCQAELALLQDEITRYKRDVIIIDPAYLCLLTGQQAVNAGNVFEMGPRLATVASACLEAGATPLLVWHAKKTTSGKNASNPYEPIELEDLSWSGIQEFARQWLLVNRREAYEPGSGQHNLWLSVGGSCGQSGLWGLDVNEGQLNDDFSGRVWNVKVNTLSDVKLNKSKKKNAKVLDDATVLLDYIKSHPATTDRVKRQLRINLSWGSDRLHKAIAAASGLAWIETAITNENGATHKRDVLAHQVVL